MKTLWTLLLSIGLLAAANSADAGVLGRHLGLGWSNGYHADCDCDSGCRFRLLDRLHSLRHHSCGKGKGKCKGAAPGFASEPYMPSDYVPAPMVVPQ